MGNVNCSALDSENVCSLYVLRQEDRKMTNKRMQAWCYGDGLIVFGQGIPDDAYAISDGGEEEMAIVRRLAHEDGGSYWVPGVRDDRDWKDRIEAFADACTEHLDDGFSRFTEAELASFDKPKESS